MIKVTSKFIKKGNNICKGARALLPYENFNNYDTDYGCKIHKEMLKRNFSIRANHFPYRISHNFCTENLNQESENVIEIEDFEEFNEIIQETKKYVVVFMYASWCPNSSKLLPKITSVISNYKDNVLQLRIDIDENSDFVDQIPIKGVPTTFIMKLGQIIESFDGDASDVQVKKFIDFNIN